MTEAVPRIGNDAWQLPFFQQQFVTSYSTVAVQNRQYFLTFNHLPYNCYLKLQNLWMRYTVFEVV